MANYNYITLDAILSVINDALADKGAEKSIESSRGNVATVKIEASMRNGKPCNTLAIRNDKASMLGILDDMNTAEVVKDIFIKLNCHMKIGGEYKLIYKDISYCNNPRHELYGHIVDLENGNIII